MNFRKLRTVCGKRNKLVSSKPEKQREKVKNRGRNTNFQERKK